MPKTPKQTALEKSQNHAAFQAHIKKEKEKKATPAERKRAHAVVAIAALKAGGWLSDDDIEQIADTIALAKPMDHPEHGLMDDEHINETHMLDYLFSDEQLESAVWRSHLTENPRKL